MESIQEFANSGGSTLRVDRRAGVIRGVRIIGLESANGRRYLPEALQRAILLYERAKVNVNHPAGNPAANRDYRDRLGSIRNVSADNGGLRGDLHYNPKHALAEQLAWDAEHAPENIGLSHNVEARTSRRDGKQVVEEITRVVSVDLVADPAATRGLFESEGNAQTETEEVRDAASFARAITGRPQVSQRKADTRRGREPSEDAKRFAKEITR
jgi:hypothetical protein